MQIKYCFKWSYLQSIYIVFPGFFQVNTTRSLYEKDFFQRKTVSWSPVSFFVTLDKFPGKMSQCLQTSNHISLSDAIQKYFQMLDPGFPFYRQEMALVITQQVPVFIVWPGSFFPSARCKETHRSPFGYLCQQSTAPTCFKQACLTWFTVSLIQCLSIPWFQFFNCKLLQSSIKDQDAAE